MSFYSWMELFMITAGRQASTAVDDSKLSQAMPPPITESDVKKVLDDYRGQKKKNLIKKSLSEEMKKLDDFHQRLEKKGNTAPYLSALELIELNEIVSANKAAAGSKSKIAMDALRKKINKSVLHAFENLRAAKLSDDFIQALYRQYGNEIEHPALNIHNIYFRFEHEGLLTPVMREALNAKFAHHVQHLLPIALSFNEVLSDIVNICRILRSANFFGASQVELLNSLLLKSFDFIKLFATSLNTALKELEQAGAVKQFVGIANFIGEHRDQELYFSEVTKGLVQLDKHQLTDTFYTDFIFKYPRQANHIAATIILLKQAYFEQIPNLLHRHVEGINELTLKILIKLNPKCLNERNFIVVMKNVNYAQQIHQSLAAEVDLTPEKWDSIIASVQPKVVLAVVEKKGDSHVADKSHSGLAELVTESSVKGTAETKNEKLVESIVVDAAAGKTGSEASVAVVADAKKDKLPDPLVTVSAAKNAESVEAAVVDARNAATTKSVAPVSQVKEVRVEEGLTAAVKEKKEGHYDFLSSISMLRRGGRLLTAESIASGLRNFKPASPKATETVAVDEKSIPLSAATQPVDVAVVQRTRSTSAAQEDKVEAKVVSADQNEHGSAGSKQTDPKLQTNFRLFGQLYPKGSEHLYYPFRFPPLGQSRGRGKGAR